jgi:hypothetical protein
MEMMKGVLIRNNVRKKNHEKELNISEKVEM